MTMLYMDFVCLFYVLMAICMFRRQEDLHVLTDERKRYETDLLYILP